MNCLGSVVERDARPPIRMAKKTGDRTKRPTSCLFYFFTLKSLFTFLLFYFFTFKSFSSPAIDIIKRLAGSNFIYSKIIKSPMVLVHYTCIVHADIIHQNDTYRWCYIFFFHPFIYFFTFFPFTIYIPSGRPSSDEPLRTR